MSALLDEHIRTRRTVGEPPPAPALTPERAKALLFVAFRPAAVMLVALAALTILTLVLANSDLTGTSGAIAASWIAAHQVKVTIGSTGIGILPLLPTALLLWMSARACAKAVEPSAGRREIGVVVGASVGGPFVVTIISLAVIKDASAVLPLVPPNTLITFLWVVGLHLFAAFTGIASRRWRQLLTTEGVPEWAVAAAIGAANAGRRLLLAATAVTVVSMLASWSTLTHTFETNDGFVGVLGVTALSLAYLPNVVIGTAAVITGSAAHVGVGSVSAFSVVGAPVPGLPVMTAVPTGPAASWWPALLVIPVVVAVLLGRECARATADRIAAAKSAAAAALVVAVGMGLLGFVAGGDLGSFGHVGVDVWMFLAATLGFLALIGAASAYLLCRGQLVEPELEEAPEEPPARTSPTTLWESTPAIAMDGELVGDEQIAVEATAATASDDIVDAEVVDLPKGAGDTAD